jgi:hypothetical protein
MYAGCGGMFADDSDVYIGESPHYPLAYAHGVQCAWTYTTNKTGYVWRIKSVFVLFKYTPVVVFAITR